MRIVYTAIFGNYDKLQDPVIVTPGIRYICITDQPLQSAVWEIVQVNLPHNSVRNARMVKICIHKFFPSFKKAMWIDANQQINCDVNKIFELSHGDFTLMHHPDRNCVYAEAEECVRLVKDSGNIISRQMDAYMSEDYPHNNGMVATGLIIINNTKKVNDFCAEWFEQVEKYSFRDQLSFNYTLWKNPIPVFQLPFETLTKNFIRCNHVRK